MTRGGPCFRTWACLSGTRSLAMSMTDPIADMLTRIRNAVYAGHRELSVPASKQKQRIAEILKEEGYIADYGFSSESNGGQGTIKIDLKWQGAQPAIEGVKRVSRPGQRR